MDKLKRSTKNHLRNCRSQKNRNWFRRKLTRMGLLDRDCTSAERPQVYEGRGPSKTTPMG